jgi:hypothetical protein
MKILLTTMVAIAVGSTLVGTIIVSTNVTDLISCTTSDEPPKKSSDGKTS